MSYSVAQNTSFLTSASILQKAVSFIYFTLIARIIGVEDTGQYFFAIAFTAVFAVIADFGMSSVLTRETARNPEKTDEYFNTIFLTKVIFGFFTYLLVVLVVNLLHYSEITRVLIYLSGLTMFFDNLHACFYSIFRAKKNLIFESIGVIGSQVLTLIIGSLALVLHWPLYWLILAYAIPSFINAVYSGLSLFIFYNLNFSIKWSPKIFKLFLLMAAPFALSGLVSRLHSYGDSMLMSKMLTPEELGWWSVPYKITFAFQFLPVALSASIYPVVSEMFVKNKNEIIRLLTKSWQYLFLLSLPICIGLIVLAKPIIYHFYGEAYDPSVLVLQIILPGLVFSFLAMLNGAVLNAINKQKIQTIVVASALFLSILINIITLPKIGILGAAFASLASNLFFCLAGVFFVKKYIGFSFTKIFKIFIKVFIPAILMGVFAFMLLNKINFLIIIPFSAIVYFGLLFIFGGLDKEMILDTKNKLFKKTIA